MYTCTIMHEIIVYEKRVMNLKENGKEYLGGFGRKKGKGEML